MVRYDNKDGAVEPRLYRCLSQKFIYSVVCVFDSSFARLRLWRNINSSFRIGKRTMVRDGHDLRKKGCPVFMILIQCPNCQCKQIFISNSPNVLVMYFILL